MATITTVASGDLITNSRTDLNNNFANLNSDKIETSYIDTDTTLAANSDSKIATQKAVKTYVDAGGNVNASTTTKGIVEEATQAEVDAGTATGGTGARLFVNPSTLLTSSYVRPGGNGTDGALSITSGTTTIDCASAKVVIKNYTSISITGTGKLAFSNPHANGTIIIIKSQGNVTLTSSQAPMIDGSFLGAEGGAAVTRTTTGNSNGVAGTDGKGLLVNKTGGAAFSTSGVAGAAGTILSPNTSYFTDAFLYPMIHSRYPLIFVGAGGASGPISSTSNGTGTSGVGGRGGGGIIIECSGAWNFTTAGGISVAGQNGGDGVNTSGQTACSGGGGGGGGFFLAVYNSLTASSGTVTVTGGTGGIYNETYNDSSAGGSGGGGYAAGQGGGTTGTSGVKNGGDGGVGLSLIASVSSI